MNNTFKLYLGVSGYWQVTATPDELTKDYYNKCMTKFCKHVLLTYYVTDDFLKWTEFMVEHNIASGVDVMLDSGAFSIWREGTKDVNLDEYIEFALMIQEEKWFKSLVFVSLDKIPGTAAQPATTKDMEEAANTSLKNYNRMKERGVKNVLYVYHLGEPIEWLGKVVDAGADYIGLGGLARGAGSGAKRRWLESVFSYLQDYPEVGAHGFGITASPLVFRYPWRSVDSVTAFLDPGYGKVSIFRQETKKITSVYVGTVLKDRKTHQTEKKFLENRFDVAFEQFRESLWCRRYFSILEWAKFEEAVREKQRSGEREKFQRSILGGKK